MKLKDQNKLFTEITPESTIVQKFGLEPLVYAYLLSIAEETSAGTYYVADKDKLWRVFKKFPKLHVEATVKSLETQGMLQEQGVKLWLGESFELYTNAAEDVDYRQAYSKIRKALKALMNALPRKKEKYAKHYAHIDHLNEEGDAWNVVKFSSYWKIVYETLTQEEMLPFTSKEKGQMGHLLRIFGNGNLLKIAILEYIENSEKYTRDYISVGGLLVNRHKVQKALQKSLGDKAVISEDDGKF
jgi:hypothetical protein